MFVYATQWCNDASESSDKKKLSGTTLISIKQVFFRTLSLSFISSDSVVMHFIFSYLFSNILLSFCPFVSYQYALYWHFFSALLTLFATFVLVSHVRQICALFRICVCIWLPILLPRPSLVVVAAAAAGFYICWIVCASTSYDSNSGAKHRPNNDRIDRNI